MTCQPRKRRTTLIMLAVAFLYVAGTMLAVWLQSILASDSLAHKAVAGLPLIGALALVWAGVSSFLAGDELERQAAAIAAVVTLSLFAAVTLSWGILQALAGLPPINPIWWGAIAMASWSLIFSLVWKRYQ